MNSNVLQSWYNIPIIRVTSLTPKCPEMGLREVLSTSASVAFERKMWICSQQNDEFYVWQIKKTETLKLINMITLKIHFCT